MLAVSSSSGKKIQAGGRLPCKRRSTGVGQEGTACVRTRTLGLGRCYYREHHCGDDEWRAMQEGPWGPACKGWLVPLSCPRKQTEGRGRVAGECPAAYLLLALGVVVCQLPWYKYPVMAAGLPARWHCEEGASLCLAPSPLRSNRLWP